MSRIRARRSWLRLRRSTASLKTSRTPSLLARWRPGILKPALARHLFPPEPALYQWGSKAVSEPAECAGRCYSLTESGAGYIDPECPKHGCTCPPHLDGIGREKWPDCPVHSLREETLNQL